LPELDDYAPSGDGRSALARATEWLKVGCPNCDGEAERETDTLDTYICSSWYELRYFDPANDEKVFDPSIVNKWTPIDFYNGGDHATAHLIYVRFMARFFHTLGLLEDPEPFKKFLFNGKVTASDGTMFSKSKGNGIDPLEIINQGYGADALRTYLMFAVPLDQWMRWDPQGVPATHRFLSRIWNMVQEYLEADVTHGKNEAVDRIIHPVIQKVTSDLEQQKYNTAIAAMMKCVNDLYVEKAKGFAGKESWQYALESLVALVGPFAPHTADELWQQLGHDSSVSKDSWPTWDDAYLISDMLTLAVQVNGKLRAEITVNRDASKEDIETTALENDKIVEFLANKKPARVIYVPGRVVNIVI
ncbi:MAG: class I tRNA ligase family protein, partial [Candidatus Saccharimonadales bacterium]